MSGRTVDAALSGLFGDDELLLAIPRLGESFENTERLASADLLAAHDLRLSDLLALDRIARAGADGIRTNTLARALGIPSNRLTYQLAGLQERAFITRSAHPRDGRGIVLRLTPAGKAMHKKALATYRAFCANSLAGLGPEIDGRRILAAAAILCDDAPPPPGA